MTASGSGRTYDVRVALPLSYEGGDARYPVLVVLDADLLFGLAVDTSRLLPLEAVPVFLGEARVPETIVVGIGYPGGIDEMSRERGRDLDPAPEGEDPETVGAEAFHRFLVEDALPWVDATWRTEPEDRTLVGVSRGGVFALLSAFAHPGTFARIAAISPVVEAPVLEALEEAEPRPDDPARLWLSSGTAGDIEAGIAVGLDDLTDRLGDAEAAPEWTRRRYDGESHASVVPRALVDSLVWLFATGEEGDGPESSSPAE